MRRDSKAFRERFQRWKAGEAVYDAGKPIEHYADGTEPDALRTAAPIRNQYRQTILDLNKAIEAIRRTNTAQISSAQYMPKQLEDYYRNKQETEAFMARKRAGEQAADEMMAALIDPRYIAAGGILGGVVKGIKGAVTGSKLYKAYKLSKAINKEVKNLKVLGDTSIPGQIGWAPKTTVSGYHASNEGVLNPDFWFNGWAQQTHGAPHGFYIAGGNAPEGGFLAKRPYVHQVEATFDKPMVQVGDIRTTGKNNLRNQIEREAQSMGADGIIYQDIRDNQLSHQHIAKTLNPDVNVRVKLNPPGIRGSKKPYTSPESRVRGKAVTQNENGTIYVNPKDPEYVDLDGNVNIRNVVSLIKNFYKSHPNAQPYKQIINSSGNLYEHTRDVVKSAQSIPVPKGYTRQQLVQAALFHDIGKVFERGRSHGEVSAEMLEDAGIKLDRDVISAVRHHMTNSILDKDELTKALHLADVARGRSWDDAAFSYPHLTYQFDKPKLNIPKMSIRDELKYRINPWLKARGYETIKLDLPEEQAWKELEDRIIQHRSFLRGARDPYKVGGTEEDRRNAKNAITQLVDQYGMPKFLAESPESEQLRTHLTLTNVPLDPTGSGRSYLFDVEYPRSSHYFGPGLPMHERTYYSKMIGANPNTTDGLYISTSDDVGNNYASSTNNRFGDIGLVTLPPHQRVAGESMSEHLLKNDFELVNLGSLQGRSGKEGLASTFEGPYRLQTGRSLQKDLREAGIIKPPFKRDYNSIMFPGDVDSRTGNSYDGILQRMQQVNDDLQKLGIKFQLTTSNNGAITNPKAVQELSINIGHIDQIAHQFELGDLPPRSWRDPRLGYSAGYPPAWAETPDWFEIAAPGTRYDLNLPEGFEPKDMPGELLQQLAEEEQLNPISNAHPEVQIAKSARHRDMMHWPQLELLELKADGFITQKQYDAAKKAYKFGGDPTKYVNPQKIAQKMLDKYFSKMKGRKFKAYTPDYKNVNVDPAKVAEFLREHGVVPRYEIEGYGDNTVYSIEAPHKNMLKNAKGRDLTRIYGYVLGKKGEKVLDLTESLGYDFSKSSARDVGKYSKRKVSRKTLRNLLIPIIGGSALNSKRNEKTN